MDRKKQLGSIAIISIVLGISISLIVFYGSVSTPGDQNDPASNWRWVSGSNIKTQASVYGTKGITDPANVPCARDNAASWTGLDGKFWLFGGRGYDASLALGCLNDLWQFNVTTGLWTWVNGSSEINQVGHNGMMGIEDSENTPCGRYDCATWTDSNGNLWLFGGRNTLVSEDFLNDLWRFNVTSGSWTWINGSINTNQLAIYGTQHVENSANTPGGRFGAASWTGANGNLWLFGGSGYGNITKGRLNDLWRFNITSGAWCWESGSPLTIQKSVFGTQGEESASNCPGARYGSVTWTDADGDLWLFGGDGYNDTTCGLLNDLWRFNASSGKWCWEYGSAKINQEGTFGTKGIADYANMPGGSRGAISWIDSDGCPWFFGGTGYAESNKMGYLNDLWQFNLTSGAWTWMSGDKTIDQKGIYGTKGTSGPTTNPGGRCNAVSWIGAGNTLFLFGGYGPDATDSDGILNSLFCYMS